MNPIFVAMAVALGISIGANVLQGIAYLDARDDRVLADANLGQARASVRTCSAGVERLQLLAAKRGQEAAAARRKADQSARDHERRAQEILVSAPAVPGDDCRSADVAIRQWLQGRAKP